MYIKRSLYIYALIRFLTTLNVVEALLAGVARILTLPELISDVNVASVFPVAIVPNSLIKTSVPS